MLRWIFRVLLVIIDLLLWETGLVGIPNSIIGQTRYLNTLDDYVLLRILAIVLALIVASLTVGPTRLEEWRKAIVARGLGMGAHRNDEESGKYIDNRSQSMSNSPGSQQAFGDIINQGPQSRGISQSAGDTLASELQKHEPEQFQISSMQDAESGELGAMLRHLLQQGGWQMVMESSGVMLSGGPPRGVIVETTTDSKAVDTFILWLRQVNLNPQVNREEHRFGILTRGFDDSPPAPVHVVVGVLPR